MNTNLELKYTTDYSMFRKLVGNRDVDRKRIDKVKNSIINTGLKCVPILCNDKMEICEGQARLQAYKELNLPVPYIVQEGLTINDAISLNVASTKWTLLDYVKSYAKSGNTNYKFVLNMCEKYPVLSPKIVIQLGVKAAYNSDTSKSFKEGKYHIDAYDMIVAENRIIWLAKMAPLISGLRGLKAVWLYALAFCYNNDKIDNDKLASKMEELHYRLKPAENKTAAIAQIEEIYNYHCHGKKLYISQLYREYMDSRS